jgi:hypothetical protein
MTATATGNPPAGQGAPSGRVPARGWGKIRQVFAADAASGADAFTGLEAGIIVLTLVMAAGCVWGLSGRLAEYR